MNIEECIEIVKCLILYPTNWIVNKEKYKGNLKYIGSIEGNEAIETLLTAYEEKCKELKKEIQDDLDVRNRWGLTLQELEKEKEKNKEIEIIVNKLMPLAECSYWNYENHTCTHTCRGCDDLNEDNKRTSSGILIDKDRYCRLYEDGNVEKDTKFVDVEDLIKRHLKEE